MPESKSRPGARQRARRASRTDAGPRVNRADGAPRATTIPSNPGWFVPVMCALFILGVLWVATFYITSGDFPIGAIGYWNLAIGMGLIMAGFIMATRWR